MDEKFIALRKCPICGNQYISVLYKMKMELIKGFPLPSDFSISCCTACGFVYHDTSAKLKDYENYYEQCGKYYTTPVIAEETAAVIMKHIEVISKFIKKDDQILDMGCASGLLLTYLKNNGFYNVTGIDPSKECTDYMNSHGITAYQGGTYSKFERLHKKFDVIILSSVLEHIYDLHSSIEALEYMLKDDGIFYFNVPDAVGYGEYFNPIGNYFNQEHINHFSTISIDNLMGFHQYRCVYTQNDLLKTGDSFNLELTKVYKKDQGSFIVKKDELSAKSVEKYLDTLLHSEKHTADLIDSLYRNNEEIMIWGAGAVAMGLFANTNLKMCHIEAFIDKDSGKHGKTIGNIVICPPDKLKNFSGTIVVCSSLFSTEIVNEIHSMGLHNKIVILK